MLPRMHKLIRILTLVLFSMFSLSPVYAAFPAMNRAEGLNSQARHHVEFGILWLDVLVDLLDEDAPSCCKTQTGDQELQAVHNEDIVLINKKRAICKKYDLDSPPLAAAASLSRHIGVSLPVVSINDVPCDMIHRHSDGHYSRSTGLSPPSHLS